MNIYKLESNTSDREQFINLEHISMVQKVGGFYYVYLSGSKMSCSYEQYSEILEKLRILSRVE